MSGSIDYLMQFVPVIIGVIIMLFLREIKPREAKIKLLIKDGVGEEKLANQEDYIKAGSGVGECVGNLHLGVFKRMVYDELIVKGLIRNNADGRCLAKVAFEKLGFLDIGNLYKLDERLTEHKPERLHIYVPCRAQLLSQMLSFSGQSGLLMAYLINYKLEVVV